MQKYRIDFYRSAPDCVTFVHSIYVRLLCVDDAKIFAHAEADKMGANSWDIQCIF